MAQLTVSTVKILTLLKMGRDVRTLFTVILNHKNPKLIAANALVIFRSDKANLKAWVVLNGPQRFGISRRNTPLSRKGPLKKNTKKLLVKATPAHAQRSIRDLSCFDRTLDLTAIYRHKVKYSHKAVFIIHGTYTRKIFVAI